MAGRRSVAECEGRTDGLDAIQARMKRKSAGVRKKRTNRELRKLAADGSLGGPVCLIRDEKWKAP